MITIYALQTTRTSGISIEILEIVYMVGTL